MAKKIGEYEGKSSQDAKEMQEIGEGVKSGHLIPLDVSYDKDTDREEFLEQLCAAFAESVRRNG